ncbi:adult-specific rigid cuticular protein 15.7-like [Haemaphysalis longicornis]
MKECFFFAAFLAVGRSGYVAPVTGFVETESSTSHHSQDVAGNYDFGYKERHPGGSSFRQETGNPWGHKVGAYGIADIDGRVRLVKYVADANGFRVHIATNEPGTAPSSPAAVGINAPVALPVPVEPLVLAPTAAVGVSPGTAAHVYGPAIEQAVFKPAYAKKPFLATHAAPAPLEVEYDTRGHRHW